MENTVLALIFLIISFIVRVHGAEVNSSPCGDDSWTPYKDEKCVKLFKTFLTRLQAQQHCNNQISMSDDPSLVTIKSAAEQAFLNEYVFNSSDSNSVWIGAERRLGSETAFVWSDGTPVERFTNWKVGSPSNIVGRQCVQMHTMYSRELSAMEWTDISCNGGSWFICQKLQTWPIEHLQRAILNTRAKLQRSIDDFTDQITEIRNLIINMKNEMMKNGNDLVNELRQEMKNSRNDLENELRNETTNNRNEMRSETTKVRTEMATMSNGLTGQLQTLQANPVPIGFIYVQLSGQPEPRSIWNTVTWTEVTSQYAGLFFRAVGGNSTAFGIVQEGASPEIIRIHTINRTGALTTTLEFPLRAGANSGISSGAPFTNSVNNVALLFEHRSVEVRPRNSAIRIWRRSQ